MGLDIAQLRAPRPTTTRITWEGEEVVVIYDRNAFTMDLTESTFSVPIMQRLVQVLLGWDVLQEGRSWQPEERADPIWDTRVRELRVLRAATEKATRVLRETQAALAEGAALDRAALEQAQALTDEERADANAEPPTEAERRAAYQAAWSTILEQLPREFVRAVDRGILDDFLGESWRAQRSGNGSAPTANTGGGPGGTTTR